MPILRTLTRTQKYGPGNGYAVIEHKKYPIEARIHTISAYSAHADQKNLLDFVKRMVNKPSEIRIVHGDIEAKQLLKEKFEQLFVGNSRVVIPSE